MRSKEGKVYIGGLLDTVKREELEKELARFGRVTECWVAHNPPGFAFAEFASMNDAENAVKSLDGKNICGSRVRVQMSHSDGPKFEARLRRPLLGARGTLRVPVRRPLGRTALSTQHQRRPLLGVQGSLRVVKRLSARRTLLSTPSPLPYMSTHSAHQMLPQRRQLSSQSHRRMSLDRRMSPEPYHRMSPEPYRRMSPEPYCQMLPEPYCRMSPDPYRRMSLDPYHRMSPEPYRRMSPEPYRQQPSLQNSRHTSHASLHSNRTLLPLPDASHRALLPPPDGTRRGLLPPPDDFHRAILPLPDGEHHGTQTPHRRSRHSTLSPSRRLRRSILPLPHAEHHATLSPPRRSRRGILPLPNTAHHPTLSPPRRPRRGILLPPDGVRRGILPLPDHRAASSPPRRSRRAILPLPDGAHHATMSPPRHPRHPILPLPDAGSHDTSPPRRQRRAILLPPEGSRRTILPHPRNDVRDYLLEVPIVPSHYEGSGRKPRHYPEQQHNDIPMPGDATYRTKAPLLVTPTPQYRSRSPLVHRHRLAPSVSTRTRRDPECLPREQGSERNHRHHTSSHVTAAPSSEGSSRSAGKHRSRKT